MLGPHAVTLALITVLAGFGMADGGAPKFGRAFLAYLPAVVVGLIVDLVRDYRRTKAATQPKAS